MKLKIIINSCLALMLFSSLNLAIGAEKILSEVVEKGEYTFFRFCSVCHGQDARGKDTGLNKLTNLPPDLTFISSRHGGTFPWIKLFIIIKGEEGRSGHNSSEMPEWGELFDLNNWAQPDADFAEEIVHGRILELLLYLESIQSGTPG